MIKVQIDLKKLYTRDYIDIDDDFDIDLNVYQSKDIVALNNMHTKGQISLNATENLEFNLSITGIMILKDSVTLENIEYPINIEINDEYSLEDEYLQEYYKKEQNILDIMTILWENIVLEVPIRLTKTENMQLSGDGWSMGNVENNNDNIDPRLARLAELLDEGKE